MSGYVTTDFERGMDVGRQFEAARLNDENVKLRDLVLELCEQNAALCHENDKLRELVLARFACDSDTRESCADCQLSGSKPFRCVEVARELCVEVDG